LSPLLPTNVEPMCLPSTDKVCERAGFIKTTMKQIGSNKRIIFIFRFLISERKIKKNK